MCGLSFWDLKPVLQFLRYPEAGDLLTTTDSIVNWSALMIEYTLQLTSLFQIQGPRFSVGIDPRHHALDAYCESCNLNVTPKTSEFGETFCEYCQNVVELGSER